MRGFLTELKRRNVYKVAIVYSAAAWMLLEVADLVSPHMGLPDWTVSLVLLLSALGFPIAVILAWAFDLTPEGLSRTPSDTRGEHQPLSMMRVIEFLVIGLLVITVGYLYADRFTDQGIQQTANDTKIATATAQQESTLKEARSIAVLPFVNMSGDKDNEYFSDGIAEELINLLAQISDLRVVARTSAFAFKGKTEDIRAIGEKLDVDTILEGSVRKADNRLRITAQLIKVADGYHLWSHSYDREITDIFAIQDEIASAIVEALKAQLGIEPVAFPGRGTENIEAYNLFLQGRYIFHQGGMQAWPRAIAFYQRAIAVDPDYAEPFAGMSLVYDLMGLFTNQQVNTYKDLADNSLERALLLNPNLSEALAGKAIRVLLASKDWQRAETLFKSAQQGVGDRTQSYLVYANSVLIPTRRYKEAHAILTTLERNDPLNARIKVVYGATLLFDSHQTERGIAKLKEALALDPGLPLTSYVLTIAYLQAADVANAEKQVAHLATVLPPTNILLLETRGLLQLANKQPQAARETLANMISLAPETSGPYRPIGTLAIELGDLEEGMKWLEQAVEGGEPGGFYLHVNRNDKDLWEHPHFQALLKKMRLDDESLREMGYLE
ncbi:MAG: hypothetical protein V7744_11630 [Pseudomonadales bacterium]